MRFISNFNISSRFARRVLFHISLGIFIFSVIILLIKTLQNSSYKFFQIPNINIARYNAPNRAIENSQITDDKTKKDIKQELPLIHQPSSEWKVLRALLTFYPSDQKQAFESEFRWFYHSWTEMMINESSLWRTDLIVYTTVYDSIFKDLNCLHNQVRINTEEKPQCRVFSYIRIKDRKSEHGPATNYQIIDEKRSQVLHSLLSHYGYIDSINTVWEYYHSYSMYDYILRTDLDCFLTSNFALYVPYNNSLLVGHGGYSTVFNSNRLKRIAHDMNWGYADKKSLGSTWYGPPSMIYHLANYTLHAMLYLSQNEFTTPEREQRLGVMLWPEWHYGVLLLYGGHLAINHLITSENYDIDVADKLLDQGVTSKDQEDISKNYRLHLHCWHGSNPFSKFAFKDGKYDQIQPSSLISDTSASGLAMRLALESKLMTLEQLKQRLFDIKK